MPLIASTLYVRVVTGDKGRGYMLLAGYESNIVQKTCLHYTTLTAISRASLDFAIARMSANFTNSNVVDVTADGIKKRLAKEFNEPDPTKA